MAVPLRLDPGPPVLGIDIGGTDVKATLVSADGTVSATIRVPTPAVSPSIVEDLLGVVEEQVHALTRNAPLPVAVGLAVPGIVDDDTGIAIYSENLDWHDVPFRALATARLGLPVALVHDVRASALAETVLGSARGCSNVVVVTIGTGIAAGLVVDGRVVVRGGYAGEIGHTVVRPNGEACVCGNRGCLEATSSAAAIARRYTRTTGRPVAGAREVLALVESDPAAREIWNDAVDALAWALSHVTAVLAPEVIVIAGGLSEAGDALLVPLHERLNHYFPLRLPRLVTAHLGGDAGVVGAALSARALLQPVPE